MIETQENKTYDFSVITPVTVQQVGTKLKGAYKRIKGIWAEYDRNIKKIEQKMEKYQEELYISKETRANLEDEIEGIRTTYEAFCEQTNQNFDLN